MYLAYNKHPTNICDDDEDDNRESDIYLKKKNVHFLGLSNVGSRNVSQGDSKLSA